MVRNQSLPALVEVGQTPSRLPEVRTLPLLHAHDVARLCEPEGRACQPHDRQATAASPVLGHRCQQLQRGSSRTLLSALPLTDQPALTFRCRANTAWLAFSRSRRARITSGNSSATGVRHISSNSRIVRSRWRPPRPCRARSRAPPPASALPYPVAIIPPRRSCRLPASHLGPARRAPASRSRC